MRGQHDSEVVLNTTEELLALFLSYMYGRLEHVAPDLLLPLFQLADYYQVKPTVCLS